MTSDRERWVAIEDTFDDHPKILGVGALGGWAHLRAILYCARHRTDGFIPVEAVWKITHDDVDMDRANSGLEGGLEASMVEAGLWHPVADGYQVHDYLKHQANAETIREKRQRAGRLGGLASGKQRAKQTGKQTQASKLDVDVDVDIEKDLKPSHVKSKSRNRGKPKAGPERITYQEWQATLKGNG